MGTLCHGHLEVGDGISDLASQVRSFFYAATPAAVLDPWSSKIAPSLPLVVELVSDRHWLAALLTSAFSPDKCSRIRVFIPTLEGCVHVEVTCTCLLVADVRPSFVVAQHGDALA